MDFDIEAMGFPTPDELDSYGLDPRHFLDIYRWMQRSRNRGFFASLRPVRLVTGRECMEFIRAMDRQAS